jgi:hypothetical protein
METQKTGKKIGLNPNDLPEKRETGEIGRQADPRGTLIEIQNFLQDSGIETLTMHCTTKGKPDYLPLKPVTQGVKFYIHDSPVEGIYLKWWSNGKDRDWYEKRRAELSKSGIDSDLPRETSGPCLHIPIKEPPYGETILAIINRIKAIMGY